MTKHGVLTRSSRCAARRRNIIRGISLRNKGFVTGTSFQLLFLAAIAISVRQKTNCISKYHTNDIVREVVQYVCSADVDLEVIGDHEDFDDNLCWECRPTSDVVQIATLHVLPFQSYYDFFIYMAPPHPVMADGLRDLLRFSGCGGVIFFGLTSSDTPSNVMRGMSVGFHKLLGMGLHWTRTSDPFYLVSIHGMMKKYGVVIDSAVCTSLQTLLLLNQFKEDPTRVYPAAILESLWQSDGIVGSVNHIVVALLVRQILEYQTAAVITMEVKPQWTTHYALIPEMVVMFSQYIISPSSVRFGQRMLSFLLNTGRRWWMQASAFLLIRDAIISSGTTIRFAGLLDMCSQIDKGENWLRLSPYWYRVVAEVLIRCVTGITTQIAILNKLVMDVKAIEVITVEAHKILTRPDVNSMFCVIDALLPGVPSAQFFTAPICPLASDIYQLDQYGSTGHLSAIRPSILIEKDGTEVQFRHISLLPAIKCDPLLEYNIAHQLPALRCLGYMP